MREVVWADLCCSDMPPTDTHSPKSLLGARNRDRFLRALMECGTVYRAAALAEVDRPTVYRTMRAEPDFKAAVEEARGIGKEPYRDTLTEEVHRRAVDGITEPVFYRGEMVATVRKYSDTLLMFLLKREDPSYRDSYRAPEDDSGKVSLVDVITAVQQAAH